MILIGYSGQALVVYDILRSTGKMVTAYCDSREKDYNPLGLKYLGKESAETAREQLKKTGFYISIGDNSLRRRIYETLAEKNIFSSNAFHASAILSPLADIADRGVMIGAGAFVAPLATVGKGSIINSATVIEHECRIGDFVQFGPGAMLCGNITVGENAFVGAGSVVRQGIRIGSNAFIGAGSVVVKDVPDNAFVMGNPC